MDERLGGDWAPILVSPIQWRQVAFLFTEHLEMTKDPTFTDNILFLLLDGHTHGINVVGGRTITAVAWPDRGPSPA